MSFLLLLLLACPREEKTDTASPSPDTGETGPTETGDPSEETGPVDEDGDGVPASLDCDDGDPSTYPGAEDLPCDLVDSDCDGAAVGAAAVSDQEHDSLQEAVDATPDGGTVYLCPGTWTETLDLKNRSLTVASWSGNPEDTVLDGEGAHGVAQVAFEPVTFRDLGFTGADYLGAIASIGGVLELDHVIFTGNDRAVRVQASYGVPAQVSVRDSVFTDGGHVSERSAIQVEGVDLTLTVEQTVFTDNHSAIEVFGSMAPVAVTVADCTFEDGAGYNAAVSVYGEQVDLQVKGSTFARNTGEGAPGALMASVRGGSAVTVEDSVFLENGGGTDASTVHVEAFGGAWETTFRGCTFTGNGAVEGRPIVLLEGSEGAATLDACAFTGNTGQVGGMGLATLQVRDTTFADGVGRALTWNSDAIAVTVSGCAFSGQQGTALGPRYSDDASTLTLQDTRLSGNTSEDCPAALSLAQTTVASLSHLDFADNEGDLKVGYGECQEDLGEDVTLTCPGDGTCSGPASP